MKKARITIRAFFTPASGETSARTTAHTQSFLALAQAEYHPTQAI
jgi:hypothetical protein